MFPERLVPPGRTPRCRVHPGGPPLNLIFRRHRPSPRAFMNDRHRSALVTTFRTRGATEQLCQNLRHSGVMSPTSRSGLNSIRSTRPFSVSVVIACQLSNRRLHGSRCVRDLAILAHFIPFARVGERRHNSPHMHIQPDERDRLPQGPFPMHRRRASDLDCGPTAIHSDRRTCHRACGVAAQKHRKRPHALNS